MNKNIFSLAIVALFTSIVFVTEQIVAGIPNVQLTVFLLIFYTRVLGFKKTLIIVVLHTFLDNVYNGTLMFHLVIPMTIGWSLIPILLSTVFKRFNTTLTLSIFAFVFGFIYGIIFIPFVSLTFNMPMWIYFINDLPFELMMGISGAVSVGILYQPIYIILGEELKEYNLLESKRYIKN